MPKSLKAGVAISIDIVDPQLTILRLELVRQVPQQVFILAQDLGDAPDHEDVGDRYHGSGGCRLLIGLPPFPR